MAETLDQIIAKLSGQKPTFGPPRPVTAKPAPKIVQKGQQTAAKRSPKPFVQAVEQAFKPTTPTKPQEPNLGQIIKQFKDVASSGRKQRGETLMQEYIRNTQPVSGNMGFKAGSGKGATIEAEMAAYDRKTFGAETYGKRPKGVSTAEWSKRQSHKGKFKQLAGTRNEQVAELDREIEAYKLENMTPVQRLELARETAGGLPGFYDKERASALAASLMGSQDLKDKTDASLFIRAANQVMQPVSTAYTVAMKDPRSLAEMPVGLQVGLSAGDLGAQIVGGFLTGGGSTPATASTLARIGAVATRSLALDAPGYIQMIEDAGGVDKALVAYKDMIGKALDPNSKISASERVNGIALAGMIVLSGGGKIAGKGAKPTPDLPTKPLDVEAPPVRLDLDPVAPPKPDFDPVADAYSKWQGMDGEEVPSPKPKAALKPKAEPSPEKAGVSSVRAKETLYHGSSKHDLTTASAAVDFPRHLDNATSVFGAYLTPDVNEAKRYSTLSSKEGSVYTAARGPSNPYKMSLKEFNYFQSINRSARDADGFQKTLDSAKWESRSQELKAEALEFRKRLESEGYDGIIIQGNSSRPTEVASFKDVPLERTDISPSTPNAPSPKITGQAEAVPPPTPKPTGNPSRGAGRAAGAKVADQPAPEPVKAEVGKPKEAWEMTREEYAGATRSERASLINAGRGGEVYPQQPKSKLGSAAWSARSGKGGVSARLLDDGSVTFEFSGEARARGGDIVQALADRYKSETGLNPLVRETYGGNLYTKEFGKWTGIPSNDTAKIPSMQGRSRTESEISKAADSVIESNRKAAVAKALSEGKPVPASVLADYPDLAPAKPAPKQPDLKPKQAEGATPGEALPDGVVRVNTKLGVRYGKLVGDELPALSPLHKTPQEAAAYTPPVKKVEAPKEAKPVGPKLSGKELAEAGAKARAEKSLDNTKVRASDGKVLTLREHADLLASEGATIEVRQSRKYYSDKWYKRESQLKEELRKLDIFRPDYQKRSAALKAEIEAGNPKVDVYAATHKDGSYTVLTKAQYDYLQSKTSPKRTAQTKAKLDEALENFKTEHGKLHAVSNPKQEAAKLASTVDLLKALLDHAAASAGEFVLKTADDFIKFTGKRLGRDLTEGEVARHKQAWEQVHKKAGNGGGEKPKATKPANIQKPRQAEEPKSATGLARQFTDPERFARELKETKAPAQSVEKLVKETQADWDNGGSTKADQALRRANDPEYAPTREQIVKDTAMVAHLKREVKNEYDKLLRKENLSGQDFADIQAVEAKLNEIDEYAQKIRTHWHDVGMALQIAYKPDFTVADLTMRARAANGGDISPDAQKQINDWVSKYEAAQKELEELRKAKPPKEVSGVAVSRPKLARATAFNRLANLGLEVRGEDGALVAPTKGGGMKGGKQAGAVAIPKLTPSMENELRKSIRQIAKAYIVDEHPIAGSLDGVVTLVRKHLPSLSEEDILRYLSDRYHRVLLDSDLQRRESQAFMRRIQAAADYRNKTLLEKGFAQAGALLNTTQRGLQASMDLSAPFRQGRRVMVTKEWVNAWLPSTKAMFAKDPQKAMELHSAELARSPYYSKGVESGLGISSASKPEEVWAGRLLQDWAAGKGLAAGKANPLRAYANLIQRSEAHYTIFLNDLRMRLFENLAKRNPNDKEYLESIAQMINVMTGRGHGKTATMLSHPAAGNVFYAPRYTWSEVQSTGMVPIWKTKSKMARQEAIKAYGRNFAVTVVGLSLARLFGNEVELDPRGTDFLKVRLQNGKVVDVLGASQQYLRLLVRMGYGSVSRKGFYSEPGAFGADPLMQAVNNKLSPAARFLLGLLRGWASPNADGDWEKQPAGMILRDAVTPMGARKTGDQMWSDGDKWAMLNLLGIDYEKGQPKTPQKKGSRPPKLEGLPQGARQFAGHAPITGR